MATDLATALALGRVQQVGQGARQRQAMANRLMAQGADASPVYSPMAALARALTGGIGGYMAGQAENEERDATQRAIADALTGQRNQQANQREEVATITQGRPLPEGVEGPVLPALTGQGRRDALAGLAAFNPVAATTLNMDAQDAAAERQERLAQEQRRTQLQVAGIAAASRQQPRASEFDQLLGAAGIAPNSPQAQALALSRLERLGQPPQNIINNPPQETALLRADTATLQQVNEGANQARTLSALFDRAERAVRSVPEGTGAQLVPLLGQAARSLGYDIAGTSEAEVLRGITTNLATLQRVPGSGATTDFEMRLYMQAVPRLGNTREGNLALLDMGRRLAERRVQEATIWRQHIGQPDLMERLNDLGPVFSSQEREFLEKGPVATPTAGPSIPGPGNVGTAEPPPAPRAGPPAPGTVIQGFRFRGGNPADRNNWEPAR